MTEYDYSNFALMISTMSADALIGMHYDYSSYILHPDKNKKLNVERMKVKRDMLWDEIELQLPICFKIEFFQLTKLL